MESSRQLRVDAEGSVTAAPDRFVLLAAVNVMADSAADALTRVTQCVTSATKILKDQGIPDASIRTQNVLLRDWFDSSERRVTARVASHELEITTSSIEQLRSLLAELSAEVGEAFQIRGIRPTISNPDPLYLDAQEQAVSSARAKAQRLADAAGVTLGQILSIEERRTLGGRLSAATSSAMQAGGGQVVVPPVPIEPGTLSVQALITIVYDID